MTAAMAIVAVFTSTWAASVTLKYHVIFNPGNYQQAAETCTGVDGNGWDLPAPNKHQSLDAVTKTLKELMESHSLPSVWIRLQRKDFPEWTNLDNTIVDGGVLTNGEYQKTCVVMKLQFEALVSDTCETDGYGFACQLNGCSACPSSISPSNCFVKNDKCYLVGCDVATWYNAANECKRLKAEMAMFNTEPQLQEFISGVKYRPKRRCQQHWVGLRKADWYFKNAYGESLPENYQWYIDNPRSEEDCAVLKKYRHGFYWQSVNCSDNHATICLREWDEIGTRSLGQQMGSESDTTFVPLITQTATNDWTSEGQDWVGGIYRRLDFIVVIWSLTILLSATYFFWKLRSKAVKNKLRSQNLSS